MAQIKSIFLVVVGVALASLMFTAINTSYAQNEKYRAKLDGKNEVPPVNGTAEGVINFKTKGDMLTWKANVTGINDATGGHIHQGKAGENGDVIVDLLKVSKHSDTAKGMSLRGNVTASSLQGAMQGKTIDDLKAAMGSGDTYVNFHTSDHPDGIIRWQVKLKGSNTTDSATVGNSTGNNTG